MSVHTWLRLSLMFILALTGWQIGVWVCRWAGPALSLHEGVYHLVFALLGAVIGFVAVPHVVISLGRGLQQEIARIPERPLLMGIAGSFVGLLLAALLAIPLSLLPDAWGKLSPLIVALVLCSLGAMTLIARGRDLLGLAGVVLGRDALSRGRSLVLLDTSVIIDGRVADICEAGFIAGTMIVPRFVLDELQHIADSADVLRRNRGRRGLDILNRMQKDERIPLEITEKDVPGIREVDSKLVKLAQDLNCPVLTNDYNLNRVAELQGVRVLNINELANAVKAIVLPGEALQVQIIQEGKEIGQGVGYLDDGTMVVVEDGRRYMNMTVEIVVTRVLQTVAGRMIFGQLQNGKR